MVEALTLGTPIGTFEVTAPKGYRLTNAALIDGGVVARVEVDADVDRCPVCGRADPRRYGRSGIGIVDAPAGGVRTRMLVARQRVSCESCNRLSREPLPGVPAGHRFTIRCADWMRSQLGLRTNVAMAAALGLDEKSVRLFGAEVGSSPLRAGSRPALVQCASCLRVVAAGGPDGAHVHHPEPASARAPPAVGGPKIVALCPTCHADPDARWVRRV